MFFIKLVQTGSEIAHIGYANHLIRSTNVRTFTLLDYRY